ncbi:hypothetical protein [Flammeovirga sp. SJP92]|uniref:hypothetical protein n=1 Tax=Flammeovirga sp. SJP92 TaxID=1775430 RepID=UPI000787F064|nr:hypothetical protein [Flammeovirga sp. SJP92]KXX69100.1 hypothetical protein AVL50_16815 [Flammeovirga sp. SJP92]
MKIKLLSFSLLFFCSAAVFGQSKSYTYYPENTNTSLSEQHSKIRALEDQIFNLEMKKKRSQQKLRSNRTVKTIGISMDAVSLFILWPLAIPGTIMWIASPTKKHLRAIEGYEYSLHKKHQELRDLKSIKSL